MKRSILLLCAATPASIFSQVLSPVSLTGFNLDAIAENTTSLAHTTGAIDGSDYVMYSATYGTIYSTGTGLPNNGLVSSSTRTYQLQPYNQNNILYLTAGQSGSLALTTTTSYAALGMLAFATEGSATMNFVIHFDDNSTQTLSNQNVPDWFGTGSAILTGFDRCNRTSGTPNNQSSQPKMFSVDLPLACANRSKVVTHVAVQNASTNARLCVLALSGAAIPSYSADVVPVSCAGGHNGSASITPGGGFPPFSYTVSSSPAQFSGNPINLPVGVYSYTAQDVAACPVTSSFVVSQSLVPQPDLQVQSSHSVICAGNQLTLTALGASTYSWSNSATGFSAVVQPNASITYTVAGHTSQNCLRTGSVNIVVNQLPVVSFTQAPDIVCDSDPTFALSGSPQGGLYSGTGTQGNLYSPSLAGTGTHVVTYVYTDINNCSNTASTSVSVHSISAPVISSGNAVCLGATPYQVTVTPTGGTFVGNNVSATGMINTSAAGTFPYTYSISSGPCEASAASAYTVLELPVITFSLGQTTFCHTHGDVALNAFPNPGTFSGPGVNVFLFKPKNAGVGTHTLSYSHTDMFNCSNSKQVVVKVNDCTGLSEHAGNKILVFPNPSQGDFTLQYHKSEILSVVNVLGQTVMNVLSESARNTTVNMPAGQRGVFLIRDSNGHVLAKMIVE